MTMRVTELAHAVVDAEKIRLQLMLARQGRRAAFGVGAGVFAAGALALLHVLAWILLRQYLSPTWSCVILLAADVVLAGVLGMLASSSSPDQAERDAEAVKRRAMRALGQSLSITALVPVAGLMPRKSGGGTLARSFRWFRRIAGL